MLTKIIATNYINLLGIFISVFLYCVFDLLITRSYPINQILILALVAIIFQGFTFWGIFAFLICALDWLLIKPFANKLNQMIILESIAVSIPFIYLVIRYNAIIFVVAVVSFYITQMIRQKSIRKIKGFL